MTPRAPEKRGSIQLLGGSGSLGPTAVAVLVLLALLALVPGVTNAQTRWRVCGDQGRIMCARVSVPLDPSGHVRGRLSLRVERYATVAHPKGTVLALAGGPGQSAIDLLDSFRSELGSVLRGRALVVFDERGIGRAGGPACRVPADLDSSGPAISACARALGARARFYSTADTVDDIEAIRGVLRVGRLDLYGVSYGTFPAMQYARRYPTHVARIVLDSPVAADGDPAVNLASIASMRRQLRSICLLACPGLDPTGDLVPLLANHTHPRIDVVPGEPGLPLTPDADVYAALAGSDLDPFLRASIPAALHLGAVGDDSAVFRLGALAVSSGREVLSLVLGGARPGTIPLEPIATGCEDARLPWNTRDPLTLRRSIVRRTAAQLLTAQLAPFSASTVVAQSAIGICEHWPTAGAHPPREPGPLRAPTLILSGENDVRTPLEQAATLATQIAGAKLLQVPNVGHAVLASDATSCSTRALDAFFAASPVRPCPPAPPPPVDPLPPLTLAALAPAAGLAGLPGQVLTASVLTLRHDVAFVYPYLESLRGSAIPGVTGTAGGSLYQLPHADRAALAGLSYVPGVALSGTLRPGYPFATGRLSVNLNGRPYGALHLHRDGTNTGTLGGLQFTLTTVQRDAIDTTAGLSSK